MNVHCDHRRHRAALAAIELWSCIRDRRRQSARAIRISGKAARSGPRVQGLIMRHRTACCILSRCRNGLRSNHAASRPRCTERDRAHHHSGKEGTGSAWGNEVPPARPRTRAAPSRRPGETVARCNPRVQRKSSSAYPSPVRSELFRTRRFGRTGGSAAEAVRGCFDLCRWLVTGRAGVCAHESRRTRTIHLSAERQLQAPRRCPRPAVG